MIIAWANGEAIEYKYQIDNEWYPTIACPLSEGCEYRIEPSKTYRLGQRFELGQFQDVYLLCSTDLNTVSLNNLETGRRWSTAINVKNNLSITEKEMFDLTSNYEFKLVK